MGQCLSNENRKDETGMKARADGVADGVIDQRTPPVEIEVIDGGEIDDVRSYTKRTKCAFVLLSTFVLIDRENRTKFSKWEGTDNGSAFFAYDECQPACYIIHIFIALRLVLTTYIPLRGCVEMGLYLMYLSD